MNHAENGKAFLEHYGVRGMRWGVRRSQKQLDAASNSSSGGKSGGSDTKEKAPGAGSGASDRNSRGNKKSLDELSDKELKDVVNRMNLEQQYSKLTPKSIPAKAAKFAGDIASTAVKQELANQASAQLRTQLTKKAAKKAVTP